MRQAGQRRQATGGKMRLICPNCGAQYEVPDEVIPESGRDVQCSNCGDTWFQHHPDHEPEERTLQDEDTAWVEDEQPEFEAEPDEETPEPEPAYDDDYEDALGDEPPTAPERRDLDPSIAEVLREEAAREEQARAAEQRGGLETQQELGLEQQDGGALTREEQARARMARLRGKPEDTTPDFDEDAIDPSSRRNLLPDIEEISSSLNSETRSDAAAQSRSRSSTVAPAPAPRVGGFRAGFRLVVILAVLGLVLYVFAPRLSDAVPALAEPLSGYVNAINNGRNALAELVNDLAGSLSESEGAEQ